MPLQQYLLSGFALIESVTRYSVKASDTLSERNEDSKKKKINYTSVRCNSR